MNLPLHQLFPYLSRLLLALFFGSVIGWQRQMHGSAAGLRTHILVCVAANLVTCVDSLTPGFQGKLPAAVITGVGFLGAGTILRSDKGDSVHGLTTAASVWATAGIGIALGSGTTTPYLGAFAALLVLATLSVVFQLEEIALRKTRLRSLSVVVPAANSDSDTATVERIMSEIKQLGIAVEGMRQTRDKDQETLRLHLKLHLPDSFQPDRILIALSSDPAVSQATWEM